MTPRPSRLPLHRRWRARIERYTPDGALGRWLLGSPVGALGLWFLALALFDGTVPALASALLLGLAVSLFLFAGPILWPVYLSLIGLLESAEEYSVGQPTASDSDPAGKPDADSDEDPLDTLKRRYANGELAETEFERHLERLLEVDSIDRERRSAGKDRTDASTNLGGLERERE